MLSSEDILLKAAEDGSIEMHEMSIKAFALESAADRGAAPNGLAY